MDGGKKRQPRAEIDRLKDSEITFRAILNTATDGILRIDADHRVILFNDAAERMFGYAREEMLGRDLGILIPPQYGDHRSHVRRFLETRQPKVVGRTLQMSGLRKGGEEFPIELALSYLEIKGEVTFTAIIRDLSLQKQMERKLLQSERLAAVGQAVAHVAHEIKNPLMIIGGFSRQIRRGLSEPKEIQKLDMIIDEVMRLEKLVANLGDFTKQYRLIKRPANINAVLCDVVRILEQIHPPEKYAFRLDLDTDLGEIHCDPDKLKQVFINVITNGIEAMDSGGTIHTTTSRWERGVDIRIRDEGVGIGENDLLHVFEQFYTTRERGSGLGLSISYRIVEAHGGEIWAVSSPGEGATFFIRLPRDT